MFTANQYKTFLVSQDTERREIGKLIAQYNKEDGIGITTEEFTVMVSRALKISKEQVVALFVQLVVSDYCLDEIIARYDAMKTIN